MELRPYQREALNAAKREWLAGVSRQVLVLATGLGKTVVFAALRDFLGIEKRVLAIVNREELAAQAADKIRKWNPTSQVGVEMGDSRSDPGDDFVVASIQTIGRANSTRLQQFNPDDFGLVIVDECHGAIADSYANVFHHFGFLEEQPTHKRLLFGVTATPDRSDGQGLVKYFDKIVYQMDIEEAINAGWLSAVRGFKINTSVDISKVHTRLGDFDQNELTKAVNTPARNDLVARNWLQYGEDRSTLAFTVDIQHAKDLASAFQNYGVLAQPVWGDDPHRKEKIASHKAGGIKVLTNCALLTLGYDDPNVSCIVMAKPTKSRLAFTQIVGRGTRLEEGITNLNDALEAGTPLRKKDCIVLDIADTVGKHSLISLPSLFGMGNLDLKGRSVAAAAKEISKAREEHPTIDFTALSSIDKLDSYIEEISLFKVTYAPEVVAHSKMQWVKTDMASYVLILPNKESVYIKQNFLDRWDVIGTVCGNRFSESDLPRVTDAFSFAENMISIYGKHLVTLLRRNSAWHKDKPSEDQISLMYRLRIPITEGLTKGQAHKIINQRLYSKFGVRPKVAASQKR